MPVAPLGRRLLRDVAQSAHVLGSDWTPTLVAALPPSQNGRDEHALHVTYFGRCDVPCQHWRMAFLERLLSLPHLRCLIRSSWADYIHRVVVKSEILHVECLILR